MVSLHGCRHRGGGGGGGGGGGVVDLYQILAFISLEFLKISTTKLMIISPQIMKFLITGQKICTHFSRNDHQPPPHHIANCVYAHIICEKCVLDKNFAKPRYVYLCIAEKIFCQCRKGRRILYKSLI